MAPADYPDSFDVYSPDGMIFRYASRANSHARLEGDVVSCTWGKIDSREDTHGGCNAGSHQRRAWMLDKVEDRFENSMEIDYDANEPLLPTEIRYTYHPAATAQKKIVFEYESRSDA